MKNIIFLIVVVIGTNADFDASAQQDILNGHNSLRSQIAEGNYTVNGTKKPPATDMLEIKWDNEIQSKAQEYANTCPKGHSHRKGVGENLFYVLTSGSLGDLNQYGSSACSSWASEFQVDGWPSNNLTWDLFKSNIGHATQMAWAKTEYIGCGVKACNGTKDYPREVVVVCQYSPQGNVLYQNIYESGPTCSDCENGTSCATATGLCV